MSQRVLFVGAVCAGLGVAAGAFGAHFLKGIAAAEMLIVFETAVRYQMYHALALLMAGSLLERSFDRTLHVAAWCFTLGIVLFCGSLYVVALSGIRWVGAITPLGGLAFLAGWVALARAVRQRSAAARQGQRPGSP